MDESRAAALLEAARSGDLDRLRALLPPDGMTAGGIPETALMAAAAAGHEAMVELLIQHGADPAGRDAHGRTAAHHARAGGHHHLAERLDTVVEKENTIW